MRQGDRVAGSGRRSREHARLPGRSQDQLLFASSGTRTATHDPVTALDGVRPVAHHAGDARRKLGAVTIGGVGDAVSGFAGLIGAYEARGGAGVRASFDPDCVGPSR